jgi:hypothetical protein
MKSDPDEISQLAFLAHPVRGDIPGNLTKAENWIKRIEIAHPHLVVVANWITEVRVFDDANEHERERGILRNKFFILRCDMVIVAGDDDLSIAKSSGVQLELAWAYLYRKPIYRAMPDDRVSLVRLSPPEY